MGFDGLNLKNTNALFACSIAIEGTALLIRPDSSRYRPSVGLEMSAGKRGSKGG